MERLKIMIVEDEVVVAMDLEEILIEFGCEISGIAYESQKAIDIFVEKKPCLVFMDINLGEGDDGITTVEKMHEINRDIKIVYLTAFSDDATIDRATHTNPSSYLLKPFKKGDIKVALKMACGPYMENITTLQKADEDSFVLHEGYTYSPKSSKIYFEGEQIILGKNETKLLRLLVENAGEVVSFKTIDHHIWQDAYVDDNNRRNLIYRLRCKLGKTMIETVPKIGCKLKIS